MQTFANAFSLAMFVTFVAASSVNADTFTYSGGIVTDTISTTGTYLVTAAGAQGGKGVVPGTPFGVPGGLGALLSGDVFLTAGEVLDIAVGGQGSFFIEGSGGGGGSFVLAPGTVPLVVAGGGGGGAGLSDGQGGQTGAAGSGQGGASGDCDGGGGAGLNGNGQNGVNETTCTGGGGGNDYANSFTGGTGLGGSNGGFGGGGGQGFSEGGSSGGGGGGGYSGGAGGSNDGGGGGTSYFDPSFTNTSATPGTNSGNGYVTITFEPPISEVPEPRYVALVGIFITGFGLVLRRKFAPTGAP